MERIKGHIVVIDDDRDMRELLRDFLQSESYKVTTYPLAVDALQTFMEQGAETVDLVITDLRMAQMDGMEFLRKFHVKFPEIPVILITAFGSIDTAIEAMKNGAHHYIVKPFKLAEMRVVVERAFEKRHLSQENTVLRREVKQSWALGNVIGKSQAMKVIFDLVSRISHSTANVLITGESGSGKEVIARAIHGSGNRSTKPFVAINCTAIPEALLESELFGHAKGSFTGAVQKKKGLFEEAQGGTLFLDEIGDMSPSLQAKLLRVIQERKVRPVGDNLMIDIDVRIIAATHKDLKAAMSASTFREDLYYRLSVIPIVVPSLRDRQEDIPILGEYFLKKYSASNGVKTKTFSKEAIARLLSNKWPGNVRELENVVERAVVLSMGDVINEADIPSNEVQDSEQFFRTTTKDFPTIEQLEKRYMRLVLDKTGGHKEKAAQILGINRRTLYRKEREYGWVTTEEGDALGDEATNPKIV